MKRWFVLVVLIVVLLPSAARSTGTLVIPNNIFSQPTGNLSASLLDQNWSAVASYVNQREVTLGLLSARPIAGVPGRYFFATDVNGGTLYADTGSAWTQLSPGVSSGLAQQLTGLTLANNGAATATFTVGVGAATSDDTVIANRVLISLTGGLTKSLAAWAVGTNNGCLDAGAIAAFTWYSVFAITRLDTGVVDVLCSTSATGPVMPTNYTKKRRVGSIRTTWASEIYFFSQDGDFFEWATKTTTLDVNNAAPGTGAITATLSTPNGVVTRALLNVRAGNTAAVYVSQLTASDEAPSFTVAPLSSVTSPGGGGDNVVQVQVYTNTAQQIRHRSSQNNPIGIVTVGYWDRRGQQ